METQEETPQLKKKKFIKKPKVVLSPEETDINNYINQLTPMERKVLNIAQSHLETSFNIVKSIGFQEWKKHKE